MSALAPAVVRRRALGAALAVSALVVASARPATGAVLEVRPAGGCTLADAVRAANDDLPVGACPAGSGPDELVLAPGTHAGGLVLTTDVTIRGAGRGVSVIDGGGERPLVDVDGAVHVTLADLTLTAGRRTAARATACGGALRNRGGIVLLERVDVTGNLSVGARTEGGGEALGGGLCNASGGTLTLVGSTIRDNTAQGGPGWRGGRGRGGGVYNAGRLRIESSTLSGNRALGGPDELGVPHTGDGGALANDGTAVLVRSSVHDNRAIHGGGLSSAGVLEVESTTLAFNQGWLFFAPDDGGALWLGSGGGARVAAGRAALRFVTVSGNTSHARETQGVDGIEVLPGATVTAVGSILDDPCGGDGTITSLGANLGRRAACPLGHPTDLLEDRLALGPLVDDAGTAPAYLRLHAERGAVDTVPEALTHACPDRDQRGRTRPVDGDGDGDARCDRGAVELDCGGPDGDGDGVADACDPCPAVAEPARRVPGSPPSAVDRDGDGHGDACDLCPGVWNPLQDPTDGDGDGVPDECDDCPVHWNPDQLDGDGDGHGDACTPRAPR